MKTNTLALDANKWLRIVEEIESNKAAKQWTDYLEYHNFAVIIPDLVVKEVLWLLTDKKKTQIWKEREKRFVHLAMSGMHFDFKYVQAKHDWDYYYSLAEQMIKKHKIKQILRQHGLFTIVDGKELYALHKEDLAIFISLKELGKPYYFITHDTRLKRALEIKEVKNALISEGIYFILLHETPDPEKRIVTRIKVMPEFL
ncbi:MAG: hypothetical protein KJ955_08605 [Nanoarchaeota archaeon]|nr:hypothetical protein [Nanoarchaeota archaeon]